MRAGGVFKTGHMATDHEAEGEFLDQVDKLGFADLRIGAVEHLWGDAGREVGVLQEHAPEVGNFVTLGANTGTVEDTTLTLRAILVYCV